MRESTAALGDVLKFESRARPLWPLFRREAARVKLSAYLLLAVAIGESSLNPLARGRDVPNARVPGGYANGLGLMQLMSSHDKQFGGGIVGLLDNWQDPGFNLQHGADILAYQVRQRGGVERGLAGYGGFSSWLRDPSSVKRGGPQDADVYIDKVLGRAWALEFQHKAGKLKLS